MMKELIHMKKQISVSILPALVASFFSVTVFATESMPCKEIRSACVAGGFAKGEHKSGKGLYKDCLQKILAGESVPGVTVSPDQVSACKAKKEKRGGEKSAKKTD